MTGHISLTELLDSIQETLEMAFGGETYWVQAQITNVKKYPSTRRCYLTLEEYENGTKTAEAKAVFWANVYSEIDTFEKVTRQTFTNGLKIICKVKVRYHKVYGLNLDVLQIDVAHSIGTLALEKQQTLERLVKDHPLTVQLVDGVYKTFNNRLPVPILIQSIALITAPNSDGQRDFQQELKLNKHRYAFSVTEFITTIQGDGAHHLILEQLKKVEAHKTKFDVVAIVRGGGSATDFKPFDDYALSACVAHFATPVFTGIGHDSNQSIVDLMAREQKTPTKVAALFVERNFEFENRLIDLKTRLVNAAVERIQTAKDGLQHARRMVKLSSPQASLNRGFAIITCNNKIVTDPNAIDVNAKLQTLLRNHTIDSTVTKTVKNEEQPDL